ncbi:MAG TPA: metallophosphoesterase [Rhizomicrobium sp.]|nr:metallophosphoesterase [Rhizomicrobium sp.]
MPFAASAADHAWVQAVAGGFEARLATDAGVCPILTTDQGDISMTVRAAASTDFPLVCAAPIPQNTSRASIADRALPLPVAQPQRILVLGDTGCRIKGSALQACNDPRAWPFAQLAAAAAQLKPDMVIHVGDYHYRESPCPPGNQGCAGSPWGDNWATWQADFYDPAAPLLAAAPMVLVRGNHEDCNRAGAGWLRLQGPSAFDPAAPCVPHLPPYTVDLGSVRLAVMDDATAQETSLDRGASPVYAAELMGLASIPGPVWFLHHRPIWAAISGPLGIPIGGNLALIDAVRLAGLSGSPAIAPNVELMLSGHIHSFQAINYSQAVPPQIVAGHGGDNLHDTPGNLRGATFQGRSGVTVADGLSVGGFGFLLMTKEADGWAIDLHDSAGTKMRSCRFAPGTPGRVDCPAQN